MAWRAWREGGWLGGEGPQVSASVHRRASVWSVCGRCKGTKGQKKVAPPLEQCSDGRWYGRRSAAVPGPNNRAGPSTPIMAAASVQLAAGHAAVNRARRRRPGRRGGRLPSGPGAGRRREPALPARHRLSVHRAHRRGRQAGRRVHQDVHHGRPGRAGRAGAGGRRALDIGEANARLRAARRDHHHARRGGAVGWGRVGLDVQSLWMRLGGGWEGWGGGSGPSAGRTPRNSGPSKTPHASPGQVLRGRHQEAPVGGPATQGGAGHAQGQQGDEREHAGWGGGGVGSDVGCSARALHVRGRAAHPPRPSTSSNPKPTTNNPGRRAHQWRRRPGPGGRGRAHAAAQGRRRHRARARAQVRCRPRH